MINVGVNVHVNVDVIVVNRVLGWRNRRRYGIGYF